MKLLKIGDRMVNMDLVTDIRLYVDGINLYLMSNSGGNESVLEVRGDEADVLRSWLEARAEDVSGFDTGSTGAALSDPQPYTSPR